MGHLASLPMPLTLWPSPWCWPALASPLRAPTPQSPERAPLRRATGFTIRAILGEG